MQRRMMSKEEYLQWLQTRGEAGTWDLGDCHAADRLIKHEAVEAFKKHLKGLPKPIADLALCMVEAHFGSVEVDSALIGLNCYPEWMER